MVWCSLVKKREHDCITYYSTLFCVNFGFPIQTDEQFEKFDEELKKHRELDEVSITSILWLNLSFMIGRDYIYILW